MASLSNPRDYYPSYMNNKDCSQGFCSFYCPQWCYVVYPPPPPSPFEIPDDDSSPNFSPLVIAIIGIFASAFLLVTYYTIISKYCCNSRESSHRENHGELEENHNNNNNPSLHEPWHASTTGLDEALIKSITVCKYKKNEGLVEVTDCSVCLSEFQEDESVRLLPKCSHAFHLPCIDTWLKSHSSCPLCRSTIFIFNANANANAIATNAPVIMEVPSRNEVASENIQIQQQFDENVERELDVVEDVPKTELRAFSDLGNLRGRHGTVIEIRDNEEECESIRRSVSMDHSFETSILSVADVLQMNEEEDDCEVEECSSGASKRLTGESSKSCSNRRKALHCVLSPIAMKRSFSSGRFSLTKNGRGRQGILPV